MDLPSRTVGFRPNRLLPTFVVIGPLKSKMNVTFLRGNFSPRHFDRILTCILKLGALGARGDGQKPTLLMHYCTIEDDSCVENQAANAKNRGQIKSSLFFSKDTCFLNLGSPTWARTRDLRINSPALYRLSYWGPEP